MISQAEQSAPERQGNLSLIADRHRRQAVSEWEALERRSKIAMGRIARFFGAGGLCERFEACDNRLIQFGDILYWVAALAPGTTREAIVARFILSAKNGGFGWRRRRPAKLIDLDSYAGRAPFEPAQYPLRPSVVQVEERWWLMRATRTTWVEWLSAQGLPVPRELIGKTIDHVPAPAAPAAPGPAIKQLSRRLEEDRDADDSGRGDDPQERRAAAIGLTLGSGKNPPHNCSWQEFYGLVRKAADVPESRPQRRGFNDQTIAKHTRDVQRKAGDR
jgi:hypothetical protein